MKQKNKDNNTDNKKVESLEQILQRPNIEGAGSNVSKEVEGTVKENGKRLADVLDNLSKHK